MTPDQTTDVPFDFYAWVLPDTPFLYGANTKLVPNKPNPRTPDGRWMNHRIFKTQKALAQWAASRAESTEPTYFALASFTENETKKATDGRTFEAAVRTAANAATLKSLWVDIDCGPAKQYPTKEEARAALDTIVANGLFPLPSVVVDSGNGIHAYWCATQPLLTAKWKQVADAFKSYLIGLGLRFDASVTADAARILRCPGTLNCKNPDDPKDVVILEYSTLYEWTELVGHIRPTSAPTAPGGTVPLGQGALPASVAARAAGDDNDALSGGTSSTPAFMARIARECGQIAAMEANGGADCSEPLWKAMLLLAARCADGDEWAHRLSEGHPDYDESITSAKLAEQRTKLSGGVAGPSRCASFFAERPDVCLTCPHNALRLADKPGVPLKFGFDSIRTGGLPQGFVELPDLTLQRTRKFRDKEGEWVEETVVFSPFTIRNMVIVRESGAQELVMQMEVLRRGQSPRRVNIPASAVRQTPNHMFGALAKMGLELKRAEDALHMSEFLKSYAEELDEASKAVHDTKQVGFVGDNFRLGGVEITPKGVVSTPSLVRLDDAGRISAKGSYEKWKVSADAMAKASVQLQTIVALSFGSPLCSMIGLRGFAFSFHSKKSGVGKSTAIRLGASVWGNPETLVSSLDDTEKSVVTKIGLYPNLPAYWDEVRSTGDDRELARRINTIFSLVQGRDRNRLRSDASLNAGRSWNTLMGIGTNERLLDLLTANTAERDPAFARMLEIDVPPGVDTSATATAPFLNVEENYGLAGQRYMEAVLPNREEVAKRAMALADGLMAHTKLVGGSYRFWLRAVSVVITGAAIAKKEGILDFDVSGITKLLVDSMLAAASGQKEVMQDVGDLSGRFMDWFHAQPQSWLITEHGSVRLHPDARLGAVYHVDIGTGIGLMRLTNYEKKAREARLPVLTSIEGMAPHIRLVDVPFADGTPYGSPAKRRCLRFDLRALGALPSVVKYVQQPLAVANGGRIGVDG